MSGEGRIAEAIDRNFTLPDVADSNLEAANLVDVVDKLERAVRNLSPERGRSG